MTEKKFSETLHLRLAYYSKKDYDDLGEMDGGLVSEAEVLERDHQIAERVRTEKKWLQSKISRNEWGLDYLEKLREKIMIIDRLLGGS